MEQNKKELLFEQINKISEVIFTLYENFSQGDVADEINFLSVVRDKLKDCFFGECKLNCVRLQ